MGIDPFSNKFYSCSKLPEDAYFILDDEGKISYLDESPVSLIDSIYRYITFTQDENLIAVNKRFYEVIDQFLTDPNAFNLYYSRVANDLNSKVTFMEKFHKITDPFWHAENQIRDTESGLIFKIVNFILDFFGYQAIQFYHYSLSNKSSELYDAAREIDDAHMVRKGKPPCTAPFPCSHVTDALTEARKK